MTTQPQPKSRWRKFFVRLTTRMVILLVLYVLSIGPMYWKWEQAKLSRENDGLLMFYMPLMLAAEYSPPFRTAINRYIDYWAYS